MLYRATFRGLGSWAADRGLIFRWRLPPPGPPGSGAAPAEITSLVGVTGQPTAYGLGGTP